MAAEMGPAYDAVIADAICDAIATQSKGLGAILKDLGDPINPCTWYRWIAASDELCKRYARARADQAQVMADEIVEIADTPQVGQITEESVDGIKITRKDMLGHRQLRIDARKWLAAKLLPKVYGDKLGLEHSGEINIGLADRIAKARKRAEAE